ncbi:hypothetical protein [Microbulbifer sp. GL-2]|nr:hypothetical protein [Microbulbifer sp. GL-2]
MYLITKKDIPNFEATAPVLFGRRGDALAFLPGPTPAEKKDLRRQER